MPATYLATFDDARLLVWELTESIEELMNSLDELDIDELGSKVSDKRKFEFLGARVALKTLLNKEITIDYDADGKPHAADNSMHISISHSRKWIAVMVHSTRLVGIDIEIPSDKIQKIYTRFLSEAEQNDLSNGKNAQQLQLAWSGKEALYKIIGNEAVDFANQLRIFPFDVQNCGEMLAEHIPASKKYKLQYTQHPEYSLVYCVD